VLFCGLRIVDCGFCDSGVFALVQILILRRNCKNFIFNKVNFAVEYGQFGAKLNAVKNKIGQLQPGNQNLTKRLSPFCFACFTSQEVVSLRSNQAVVL